MPEERFLILPVELLSPLDLSDGFLLGWPKDKSTKQWPNSTLVVAGKVGIQDARNISEEYISLQEKINFLRGKIEKGKFCTCNSARDFQKQLCQELKIVAWFSAPNGDDSATKKFQQQMSLPCLKSSNGRLQWESYTSNGDEGGTDPICQILGYEPSKIYKHRLSEPDSTFGSILEQLSVANCVMQHISMSSSDEASTDYNFEPTDVETENQHNQNDGVLRAFENHSFFAYHVSSMRPRHPSNTPDPRLHWAPAARVWNSYLSFQKLNGQGDRCFHCCKQRLQTNTPQEDLMNQSVSDVVDLVLGLVLGLLMGGWLGGEELLVNLFSLYTEQQFLPLWLHWLESFPIGFKLNVSLTHAIGKELRSLVILRQSILGTLVDALVSWVQLIPCFRLAVLAVPIILGGSGCLALFSDVTHLLTFHLDLLSNGFRYVYSTEIYLLGASWLLFRGKKQNILRKRTDTMEYDSMQLLLGSILFAMTLFLLTTILVYYAFFTLLNLAVGAGTSLVFWVVYVLVRDFPFGTCYFRILYTEKFCSHVLISQLHSKRRPYSSAYDQAVILEPVPESMGAILARQPNLTKRAKGICAWLGTLISCIASGKSTSKSMVEFLANSST